MKIHEGISMEVIENYLQLSSLYVPYDPVSFLS